MRDKRTRRPLRRLLAIAGLCLATSCGGTKGGDEADAAPDDDAAVESPSRPGLFQTAGGGRTSSANFRAEIRLGAPQPMGETSSSNFNARLGPSTE